MVTNREWLIMARLRYIAFTQKQGEASKLEILAEWPVGGPSVISADHIHYMQFGKDLKIQKKR